jgi:hypothetical protein
MLVSGINISATAQGSFNNVKWLSLGVKGAAGALRNLLIGGKCDGKMENEGIGCWNGECVERVGNCC